MKRATWIVIAIAVTALAAPQVVVAATGSFSTSTSTPAVTATSTYSSGRALYGKASGSTARAVHGWASNTSGTAISTGVNGQTSSGGSNFNSGTFGNYASGVKGVASATTNNPYTNGVWGTASSAAGTGVFGTSPGWGIYGIGGIYGVYSQGDLGLDSHLYQDSGTVTGTDLRTDLAGQCTVAANTTSAACNFPVAFVAGTTVVVVLTPTSDPAGSFWVSNTSITGFTANLEVADPSNATTFNYIVVGTFEAPTGELGTTGLGGKARRLP